MDVQWTVTNTGTSPVTGSWTDQLYLSQDGGIGSGDRLLATVAHTGPRAAQATDSGSLRITLPIDVSGAWQLIVRVDANGCIVEPNGENDNIASAPIAIGLAPYADLVSAVDSAPTQLIADPARVTVGWTITNNGTGAGLASSWTDNVVLSRDSVAGNRDDIVLGGHPDGSLAVGASYSRTRRCSRRQAPPGGSTSSSSPTRRVPCSRTAPRRQRRVGRNDAGRDADPVRGSPSHRRDCPGDGPFGNTTHGHVDRAQRRHRPQGSRRVVGHRGGARAPTAPASSRTRASTTSVCSRPAAATCVPGRCSCRTRCRGVPT